MRMLRLFERSEKGMFVSLNGRTFYFNKNISDIIRKEGYKYTEIWYEPEHRILYFKLLKKRTPDAYTLHYLKNFSGILCGALGIIKFLKIRRKHYPCNYDPENRTISLEYEVDHDDNYKN